MTPDPRPDGTDAAASDAETSSADQPQHPRRSIRSFVLRAGRMGSGQVKAMETLGPLYVLPYQAERLDFDQAFGRHAPTVLEIGFGMGDATAQIAAARPQDDFIGIEVHTPGVGALLQRIQERGLTNLRLLQHDAVEVLGPVRQHVERAQRLHRLDLAAAHAAGAQHEAADAAARMTALGRGVVGGRVGAFGAGIGGHLGQLAGRRTATK